MNTAERLLQAEERNHLLRMAIRKIHDDVGPIAGCPTNRRSLTYGNRTVTL
jgi:hypothetical protein